MRFICRLSITLLLGAGALFSGLANAQSFLPSGASEQAAPAQTKIESSKDALGRGNPRGTVLGYIAAMANQDYEKAVQYLDLSFIPKNKRKMQGKALAENLQRLLDQQGRIRPGPLISDNPDGESNDKLDENLDRVGEIRSNGRKIPVLVEKVSRDDAGSIWLFSSQTMEQLPHESEEDKASLTVDAILPQSLVEGKWGGVPKGHWLVMLLLVVASYLLAWFITGVIAYVSRMLLERAGFMRPADVLKALILPARIYMAVWIFVLAAQEIGISIIARQYFSEVTVIVAWVAMLIFLWRLIDVFASYGERRMLQQGNPGALSAIMFFGRSVKFVVIAIGIITVLATVGVDVTTGLAALGIGGLALALGAQKTVENLVGSLTLIFDQPVRIGDVCKVGEIKGTVEQIGMRSTLIRTLDRTLITIPNGDFSGQKIENYAPRDRFWFHPVLGLRYETSPDQIRYLLVELRSILYAHPHVYPDPRVRFTGFGADTLNIEIHAYVQAIDYSDYLEIGEDLNLRIMDVVAESGTGLAFPSQTLYLAKDTGLSDEKTKAAEAKVQEWRSKGKLDIPRFDADRVRDLKNKIIYPPEGSSAQTRKG